MPTEAERRLAEKYAKRRAQKAGSVAGEAATDAGPAVQPATTTSAVAHADALQPAKELLAKQAAAKATSLPQPADLMPRHLPIPSQAASATPAAVDPLEAAKRALAAKSAKQAAPGPRRPAVKRPAVRLPVVQPPAQLPEDEPPVKQPWSPSQSHASPAHLPDQRALGNGAAAQLATGHRPPEEGTLHVGNLPSWASDADLVEAIQPYGMIKHAHVIPGHGYGFVTLQDPEAAEMLLHRGGYRLPEIDSQQLSFAPAFHAESAPPSFSKEARDKKARPPSQSSHPKVQAACAKAEALAFQGDPLAHPSGAYAGSIKPPARALVSYDDL